MVSVSVSELKAKLSEHLRRVKAGETVLVTERGRTIAELRAPSAGQDQGPRMQRLADAGLVNLGHGVSDDFFDMPKGRDPKGAVLEALLEERAQGR